MLFVQIFGGLNVRSNLTRTGALISRDLGVRCHTGIIRSTRTVSCREKMLTDVVVGVTSGNFSLQLTVPQPVNTEPL